MIRLVYASHATVPFTEADLDALLESCRRHNVAHGVTGMLLYRDGDFLQALEGEADAVRETFARIERDPRHAGTLVLDESPIEEREFGSWAMAFRRLTPAEGPAGFVDYFRKAADGREGAASRMLAAFRELGR